MSNREVEIAVEVKAETEKAYLMYDGEKEAWIAKSQIKDHSVDDEGGIASILLAEWFAEKVGLI